MSPPSTTLKTIDPSLLRYLSNRGLLHSLLKELEIGTPLPSTRKDFNQSPFSETLVNGNPFAGIIRFYCIDGYGNGLSSMQVAIEPQFPYAVLAQLERDRPHHLFEEGRFSRFHRSEKRYQAIAQEILDSFPEQQLPEYYTLTSKQKRVLASYSPALIYASRHSDVIIYQTSSVRGIQTQQPSFSDLPVMDLGATNNGYNPAAVRHLFSLLRSSPEETIGFVYHRSLPGLFPLPVSTKPLVVCHRWPHLANQPYQDPKRLLKREENPYKQYLLVLSQPRITLDAFKVIHTAKGQVEALSRLDLPIERYKEGGTLQMRQELISQALSDEVVEAIQLSFTRHVLQRPREEQGPFYCFDPREVEFRIKFTRDPARRLAILQAAHTVTQETLYFLSSEELQVAASKHILTMGENDG